MQNKLLINRCADKTKLVYEKLNIATTRYSPINFHSVHLHF